MWQKALVFGTGAVVGVALVRPDMYEQMLSSSREAVERISHGKGAQMLASKLDTWGEEDDYDHTIESPLSQPTGPTQQV